MCTHFAVADEPDNPYTAEQLARFDAVLDELRAGGLDPGRRARVQHRGRARSARRARHDLVRVGIGIYGIAPAAALAGVVALRPAMAVKARVSYVKDVAARARACRTGLRYETDASDADRDRAGRLRRRRAPRCRHAGGEVLVRGRRCPIAGTVTMDQLMVDVGDLPVEVGDEVVLLGRRATR